MKATKPKKRTRTGVPVPTHNPVAKICNCLGCKPRHTCGSALHAICYHCPSCHWAEHRDDCF